MSSSEISNRNSSPSSSSTGLGAVTMKLQDESKYSENIH